MCAEFLARCTASAPRPGPAPNACCGPRRLLTDTDLSLTAVAQASGFGSVRRFNAALAQHYQLTPSAIRKRLPAPAAAGQVGLRLPWRAPYDAGAMQAFLAARPLPGVEAWAQGRWWRTLRLTRAGQVLTGWLALRLDNDRGRGPGRGVAVLGARLGADSPTCCATCWTWTPTPKP
jgi:hypothetical protein